MNKDHLQQIFKNYIDRFEEFNSDDRTNSSEYYKWEMPKPFKVSMDKALKAENEEVFKYELDNIRKITHDFIDSGKTLPFAGLVKAADKEWETVQGCFGNYISQMMEIWIFARRKSNLFWHKPII